MLAKCAGLFATNSAQGVVLSRVIDEHPFAQTGRFRNRILFGIQGDTRHQVQRRPLFKVRGGAAECGSGTCSGNQLTKPPMIILSGLRYRLKQVGDAGLEVNTNLARNLGGFCQRTVTARFCLRVPEQSLVFDGCGNLVGDRVNKLHKAVIKDIRAAAMAYQQTKVPRSGCQRRHHGALRSGPLKLIMESLVIYQVPIQVHNHRVALLGNPRLERNTLTGGAFP